MDTTIGINPVSFLECMYGLTPEDIGHTAESLTCAEVVRLGKKHDLVKLRTVEEAIEFNKKRTKYATM